MEPILITHGGAGKIVNNDITEVTHHVKEAAKLGYKVLTTGGSVTDAVETAVRYMEDIPLFNAGLGSVLNLNGEVEMDASIMVGSNLSAGAVTVVKDVKNPISLARLVMEKTTHVLLAGDGAKQFAIDQGISILPEGSLVTEARKKALEKDKEEMHIEPGTVGAVAVDSEGHVAAATSTGGRRGKMVGRSSDTCVIGSGTYADDNIGAVSTTGHGETIMKHCLARSILFEVENGKNAQSATTDSLLKMTARLNDTAGAITISKSGEVGIDATTEHMTWAYQKGNKICFGNVNDFTESETV